MPLVRHYILAGGPEPPTPEGAVAALRRYGHQVALVEVRRNTFELAVYPDGTRVLVDVSEDLLAADSDADTSTRELLEDWAAQGVVGLDASPPARRLIGVRHWDHAEEGAVETLLAYACAVSEGERLLEDGGRGEKVGTAFRRAAYEARAREAHREDNDREKRVAWYNRIAAAEPLERLVEMLDQRDYPPVVDEHGSAAHLVETLTGFRRGELTPDLLGRLRALARGETPPGVPPLSPEERLRRGAFWQGDEGYLEPAARRTLSIRLAHLDGDAAALRAMWARAQAWQRLRASMGPGDWLQHMKSESADDRIQRVLSLGGRTDLIRCLGDLRVSDLISIVREPGFFEPRYQAMIALGRIGPPAGAEAAEAIRVAIYDSSEHVTGLRERVCARILSPEGAWRACRACDRGRLPAATYGMPSWRPCPECLGLAWVPGGGGDESTGARDGNGG